jgi:hypothetical protein
MATCYISLWGSIEFLAAEHFKTGLGRIKDFALSAIPEGISDRIFHVPIDGPTLAFDERRGKNSIIRMIDKQIRDAERGAFQSLKTLRTVLCGDSFADVCSEVDADLWEDLLGLYSLRNMFAHGRPIAVDADQDSDQHPDHVQMSLRKVLVSLKRESLIGDLAEGDPGKSLETITEAVFSEQAVIFYWNRVGQFANHYTDGLDGLSISESLVTTLLYALQPIEIEI